MFLQVRGVDRLHVNSEFPAAIVEDEDADAAVAGVEGLVQTSPEVGLVDDGEASLDIAGLGHGDDATILDVQDTVLLEDGAKHGLDDNAGGGVGDERRLLVKLLGKQVNTEVTVLAGGRGGGDADDLAGAALEHQDVTHANVVAGDSDGVRNRSSIGLGGRRAGRLANDLDVSALGVEDAISHFVE